jgi:hypothetical protein
MTRRRSAPKVPPVTLDSVKLTSPPSRQWYERVEVREGGTCIAYSRPTVSLQKIKPLAADDETT